jgi:hypothetical protein
MNWQGKLMVVSCIVEVQAQSMLIFDAMLIIDAHARVCCTPCQFGLFLHIDTRPCSFFPIFS